MQNKMFNTIVLAHEEGVSVGTEAWLGPLIFFAIIFLAVIAGKIISRKFKNSGDQGEVRAKDD